MQMAPTVNEFVNAMTKFFVKLSQNDDQDQTLVNYVINTWFIAFPPSTWAGYYRADGNIPSGDHKSETYHHVLQSFLNKQVRMPLMKFLQAFTRFQQEHKDLMCNWEQWSQKRAARLRSHEVSYVESSRSINIAPRDTQMDDLINRNPRAALKEMEGAAIPRSKRETENLNDAPRLSDAFLIHSARFYKINEIINIYLLKHIGTSRTLAFAGSTAQRSIYAPHLAPTNAMLALFLRLRSMPQKTQQSLILSSITTVIDAETVQHVRNLCIRQSELLQELDVVWPNEINILIKTGKNITGHERLVEEVDRKTMTLLFLYHKVNPEECSESFFTALQHEMSVPTSEVMNPVSASIVTTEMLPSTTHPIIGQNVSRASNALLVAPNGSQSSLSTLSIKYANTKQRSQPAEASINTTKISTSANRVKPLPTGAHFDRHHAKSTDQQIIIKMKYVPEYADQWKSPSDVLCGIGLKPADFSIKMESVGTYRVEISILTTKYKSKSRFLADHPSVYIEEPSNSN